MDILSTVVPTVLPVISLLSGILSLYVDPQKDPKKKWVLISVLVLAAVATAGLSVRDDRSHHSESNQLRDALATEKSALAMIQSGVTNMSGIVTYLGSRFGYAPEQLRDSSNGTAVQQLENSIKADQARSSLLASLPSTTGTKPRVLYYAKDVDAEVVRKSLMEAQLDVEIRKPLDPNSTNVIWIGDKITPDVAHFAALTLVRAGVKLNKILRFHDGSGKKENLIEVGAYEAYRGSPVLTVDDIAHMTDFPTDPHAGSTPL